MHAFLGQAWLHRHRKKVKHQVYPKTISSKKNEAIANSPLQRGEANLQDGDTVPQMAVYSVLVFRMSVFYIQAARNF